jgi:hypothetical protein
LRVLSLLLALLGAAASSVFAADWQTWERYMESGQRALEQGRAAGAENWFQDAVREAERLDAKSPQLVRSLKSLVDLYRKQGRQRDAEAIEQRLAGLTSPARPASAGPDAVAALESYAALLKEGGREVDAAAVGRRAERLRAVRAGAAQGELISFNPAAELRSYAMLLRQRNRDAEALAMDMLAATEARQLIDRYGSLRRELWTEDSIPRPKGFSGMRSGLPRPSRLRTCDSPTP